eukprot:12428277-Heterocapsa_arctica.AAC.1
MLTLRVLKTTRLQVIGYVGKTDALAKLSVVPTEPIDRQPATIEPYYMNEGPEAWPPNATLDIRLSYG